MDHAKNKIALALGVGVGTRSTRALHMGMRHAIVRAAQYLKMGRKIRGYRKDMNTKNVRKSLPREQNGKTAENRERSQRTQQS